MEYPLFQSFSSHEAILSNVVIIGTVIMAVALIIGSIWLIFSSLDNKYGLTNVLSRRVENLYVKINYGLGQNIKDVKTGFLLSLGMNGATMVIREIGHLQKGSYISLYFFGSDGGDVGEAISAKITKLKCVHQDPPSYHLELQFGRTSKSACSVIEKCIMQFSPRWNR